MTRWSFYNLKTGEFSGVEFTGREKHLPQNTPPGMGAIAGAHDRTRFRVVAGEVVKWKPPAPADTSMIRHTWNESEWAWIATPTPAAVAQTERAKRDTLLTASDWTQMPDAVIQPAKLQEWRKYRKALREITDQKGFPIDIVWPKPPSA